MPIRAHKIKDISSACTFELSFESSLWDVLDDLGCLKGLGEAGGVIIITEEDIEQMNGEVPETGKCLKR